MIEFLQTVLALIVTISILVTIHEFGHYWVARLCGVHVIRFSVGFGKPFYIKHGKPADYEPAPVLDEHGDPIPIRTRSNEPLPPTEFAVAAIPLGGYVKMLDEREGYVPDDQLHLAFNRKSVWQRIVIVLIQHFDNTLPADARSVIPGRVTTVIGEGRHHMTRRLERRFMIGSQGEELKRRRNP